MRGLLSQVCIGVFTAGFCLGADPAPVDFARDIQPLLTKYCVSCHGANSPKGDLRLESSALLLQGGNRGPAAVAGKPEESPLIQALIGAEGFDKMPPKDPKPTKEEIDLLKRWVQEGAKGTAGEKAAEKSVAPKKKHWSFESIRRPEVPPVSPHFKPEWYKNPIDAFILRKLEAEHIPPAPEAEKRVLLRRVTLDLIGLPPTPDEMKAFLADNSPQAYEKVVDRLLQSPHYGEQWGRAWLDLARYADSNGFTIDSEREIWKYRDWVIDALNRDMPFNQFTIEQVAGDMLPQQTVSQQIATGFHRNTLINEEGGTDKEQFRVESVVDRVGTTGSVFLGLTLGCAQCHDHKYDPISQREFYQIYAFLNQADEPKLELPTDEQIKAKEWEKAQEIRKQIAEQKKAYDAKGKEVEAAIAGWEKNLKMEERKKLPEPVVVVLNLALDKRTPADKDILADHYRTLPEAHQKFPELAKIAELQKQEPKFRTTLVMRERKNDFRETHIQIKGDFLRLGAKVEPAVPAVLNAMHPQPAKPNRLDFARWLVANDQPLTARVQVNRWWEKFFGRGIVETENDFGTQGAPPTHPELLDWLASEFMQPTVSTGGTFDHEWGMKRLHKLIVMSATYRQSSQFRPELKEKDPRNLWLARQNRMRLPAEGVRDAALATSGLLSHKIGGPSVFPPQPEGVFDLTQKKKEWPTSKGEDRYRRGMYTWLWRSSPYPGLTVFDFPEANVACTRRNRSNTPLQALTLANDQVFVELSQGMGALLIQQKLKTDEEKIRWIYDRALGREPASLEIKRLTELAGELRDSFSRDPDGAIEAAGYQLPMTYLPLEPAVWSTICRGVMNLDEFITRE
ncbi:MAG: DUF1549 domain-containing protein [Planctomycetales bacterium]